MMKNSKSVLLAAAAILTNFNVFSMVSAASEANQELNAYNLEGMVVTATSTPIKAQDTYASVAVITKDEIERNHYNTLYEALQHVEGMHTVLYADGVGFEVSGESNPTIRGTSSVLVLVDGVDQSLGTRFRSGAVNYNMDDIERIEILRGSASTLYGANAVGGVINIITKKNVKGINNKIAYATGSYDLNRYNLSSVGLADKVFWAVSGNKSISGDMKDGHGAERNSASNADAGYFKLGTNLSETTNAIVTYQRNFQHMEWVRPYANYNETGDGSLSSSRLTFTLDYNSKDNREKNQLSFYKGEIDSKRYYYNKSGNGSSSSEIFKDHTYDIVNRYYRQLNKDHRLAAGFEYKTSGETSDSEMKEKIGLFAG